MYPINTLTALPLFQLMCALEGRESGSLVLSQTWRTFLTFCALPATSKDDYPGFQAELTRDDLDTPVVEVRLIRQITDDAAGFGPTTRAVTTSFLFENSPTDLQNVTLWARDYPDLATFQAAVEATPEFRWTTTQAALVNGFGYEDAAPDENAG